MKLRHITLAAVGLALGAAADTLLLSENFDGDYTGSVAYFFDGDGQQPNRAIASIFYSNVMEQYMPWWVTRDSADSSDRFFASHSYYTNPAASNDWLIFHPVAIPTEGFTLEFDAQSVPVRDHLNLSDLEVIVTEQVVTEATATQGATFTLYEVPAGADPDNCEGDWTHYSLPLDAFAGRTVYVNFVNRNFNSDIVCIDNVEIMRRDPAMLSIAPLPEYTADSTLAFAAELTATAPEGIAAYSVRLLCNDAEVGAWSGTGLAAGVTVPLEANVALGSVGQASTLRLEATCQGTSWPLTAQAQVTRMAFEPVHRLFVEETTSMHCSNCPMGMYTFEQMLSDPLFADRFLPVSVHIAAMGFDPMATAHYYGNMPVNNQAPVVFTDRNINYDGFIPAYDLQYNPNDPLTFAYRMARRMEQPTYLDVDVAADWVIEGNDTTAVRCTATVRPAIDLRGRNLAVAFILTENNVGLDNNRYWLQENALSGADIPGNAGGWTQLGEMAINLRYHDVARAISAFSGHEGSLPPDMAADRPYTFTYTMAVPETYNENNGYLLSDHIRRQFCNVTAIVIDCDSERVVNAARVAMSPIANCRIPVSDIAGLEGVAPDTLDPSLPAALAHPSLAGYPVEYYDLTGRRLAAPPASGLYIGRRGPASILLHP